MSMRIAEVQYIKKKHGTLYAMWKHRVFYLFLLIPIAWYLIFQYYPMFGLLLAFKEFKFNLGIIGSPWASSNGLKYFINFLRDSSFYGYIRNTVSISLLKLAFGFPAPIILALMLNSVTHQKFKRLTQTLSYLPYFINWVVVSALLVKILSPYGGLLNEIRRMIDPSAEMIFYLGEPRAFYPIVVISDIWKNIGWGSILYLSALTNVDPTLYEAAEIDGARRWRVLFNITLPSIYGTVGIMLILSFANVLNAGFDQIYLIQTPPTISVSEILDTYILKKGIRQGEFAYASAIGLFKSAITLILIILVNGVSRRFTEVSVW